MANLPVAAQHDGHATDFDSALAILALAHHDVLALGVLNVDCDGGCVGHVTQPAFLGREILLDKLILHARRPNIDVCIPGSHLVISCCSRLYGATHTVLHRPACFEWQHLLSLLIMHSILLV